jgi:hypothetical protein
LAQPQFAHIEGVSTSVEARAMEMIFRIS